MKITIILKLMKLVNSQGVPPVSLAIYSSYNPGIKCPDFKNPKDLLQVSVSPGIFGITKELWKSEFSTKNLNKDPLFYCNKEILVILQDKTEITGIISSFCPVIGYNPSISFSNGVRNGYKCYFEYSINLLYDKGLIKMNEIFSTDYTTILNPIVKTKN